MKSTTRLATGASVVALALSLAACGGPENPAGTPATRIVTPNQRTTQATTSAEGKQVDQVHNEADTLFAHTMIDHHKGAIEMADLAVQRAASDNVRSLAKDISAAQGPEIQHMTAWLEAWKDDTTPTEDVNGHGGMDMGGVSQEEAMDQLKRLSGTEFDRRFLELMIAHHEGAVTMAQNELRDGQNPQARELAQKIIDGQQAEIATMKGLLQGR